MQTCFLLQPEAIQHFFNSYNAPAVSFSNTKCIGLVLEQTQARADMFVRIVNYTYFHSAVDFAYICILYI